ncbi:MAG: hypothetical protein PHY55_04095 [Bacteroidales bacterium]|nr:hypothetical protein [Bacteroidales bacterium]
MKNIIFVLLILSMSIGLSQNNNNYIDNIKKADVSFLFKTDSINSPVGHTATNNPPIGFIGENYQRISICFECINKSSTNELIYIVKGNSRVKKNKTSFKGYIEIKESKFGEKLILLDEIDSFYTGYIKGVYCFEEEGRGSHIGKFQGEFITYFYIDHNNEIRYNDLEYGVSDGYLNNQFWGVWESYDKRIKHICNWGEYRIPKNGLDKEYDLDIGACCFSPNLKYYKYGWKEYLIEQKEKNYRYE